MENTSNKPKWLEEIENHSWNPELLISGLSIVFIYTISDQVADFSILSIQRFGLNPILVYFATVYIAFAFSGLKWTFTIHLLLRGVWISQVGLNYVFPKGIIKDKVPKLSRKPYVLSELGDPIKRILTTEKICSSIFSIAFSLIGVSGYILIFFMIMFIMDALGLSLFTVGITFVVLISIISIIIPLEHILSKIQKREYIPLLATAYRKISAVLRPFLFRESLMTFQTNLTQVKFIVGILIVFMMSMIFAMPIIVTTAQFGKDILPVNTLFKSDNNGQKSEWFDNRNYDERLSGDIVFKASIPQYHVSENVIPLFLIDYKSDDKTFTAREDNSQSVFQLNSLIEVWIGDQKIEDLKWRKTYHPITEQRGWIAMIPIDLIKKNQEHELIINKWVWNYLNNEPIYYESWERIAFWH